MRGSDGMPDLLAALELVSGPPFAQRPTGYEWLGGLDLTDRVSLGPLLRWIRREA